MPKYERLQWELLFTRDPISLERHWPLLSDLQLLGLSPLCFLPSELSQGVREKLQSELPPLASTLPQLRVSPQSG